MSTRTVAEVDRVAGLLDFDTQGGKANGINLWRSSPTVHHLRGAT